MRGGARLSAGAARWARPFVATLALATAATLGTSGSAAASELPDLEMPFPCAQSWTGTTRASHQPSSRAVDFNRPGDLGDILVSAAAGVVSAVGDSGTKSYGRWVRVDHGNGHSTLYAHLQVSWVVAGQRVDQGTALGLVGDTGNVSGAHLHYEQRDLGDVVHPWFHQARFVFGSTPASANCTDTPLAGDWDGDGRDEVAVFRRGARATFELPTEAGTSAPVRFGSPTDSPVVGDWDGDGTADLGFRRTRSRTFFLRHGDGTVARQRFGRRRELPVAGDWDGDGTDDVGVWRPSGSRFRLERPDGTVEVVRLGSRGSQPLTGDWDGDGRTDVGVYDDALTTFTLLPRPLDAAGAPVTVRLGTPGDLAVTGDWDGDGRTDLGVWQPGTAVFTLRTAPRPGSHKVTVSSFVFGQAR